MIISRGSSTVGVGARVVTIVRRRDVSTPLYPCQFQHDNGFKMIDLIESPKMRPISSNMAYFQNDDLKGTCHMSSDFLCRK